VNERGTVIDVSDNQDTENRNIIMWKKSGSLNQQWDVIYVDEYPKEPVKGELNKDFGLYVERPFYIISQMSTNKYLDMINNKDFVIKTRNGRNTQIWWFDQKSLTIKTKYNSKSWDITSSGKTNKMQVYSTNTNWW